MVQDIIRPTIEKLLPNIPARLQSVVSAYLLTLMLDSGKKTQSAAANVANINQSQISRLLSNHGNLAKTSLETLNAVVCQTHETRSPIVTGVPWTIAIIIDATLHPRSSLHVQNAQRFNHGDGFVVGHQWTNVVLLINGEIVPLPPIPFFSKNECKRREVEYKTEHARIKEFLETLSLEPIVGQHDKSEVVVITDAGYDDKKIQNCVVIKGWDFLCALKKTRNCLTVMGNSQNWKRVDDMFWATRKQAPWKTVRIKTNELKRRKRFRVRKLKGNIKGVAINVAIVCSEKSGRTGGKRYFACSKSDIDAGVLIRAYAKRWEVEMFHRAIKHQLGLTDAGVRSFRSLTAHVHWVYCAYLLLHQLKIVEAQSMLEKQQALARYVHKDPWKESMKKIVQEKNKFGGKECLERLVYEALELSMAA